MSARATAQNVWTPEGKRRPEQLYAALRAQGPTATIRFPFLGRMRLTTTYAAAEEVLKNRTDFRMRADAGGSPAPAWAPRSLRLIADNMLLYDEPEHRRLRDLVEQAFRRANVADQADSIKAAAERLASRLDPKGFDLLDALARPLPLDAITHLLGLPEEDRVDFARWSAPLGVAATSPWRMIVGLSGLGSLRRYVERRIEIEGAALENGDAPSGLVAALVAAEQSGDRLSRDELTAMIMLLLLAGMETTTHLIAGGAWALSRQPEQRERFLADPMGAIDELIRWFTPVLLTKPRIVARDRDFFGVSLKKGERIVASLYAANHDPARFERPDELDFDRRTAGHLGFGAGIHYCLGMQLARTEAALALAALFGRFPSLQADKEPEWIGRSGMRAMTALKMRAA